MGSTRDDVPIPPLNPWQIIPVPPPTLPSATGPAAAAASASRTCCSVTWWPLMSLSSPSKVSATTGRPKEKSIMPDCCPLNCLMFHSPMASRTTPTLLVLVMPMGPLSVP